MARSADLGGSAPRPLPESRDARRSSSRPGSRRSVALHRRVLAELKKVEWPGQNQVVQGTVVVLIACLIVGVYLWLNDQIWKHFVSQVLLR
jgi:preprotein translocase subunit SecE